MTTLLPDVAPEVTGSPRAATDPTTAAGSAGGTAVPGRGRVRRVAGTVGRGLVDLALVAAVLVFGFLAVGPHVLDYRTVTMLTSSMAPGIEAGDVVVVTPLPVTEVEPGMVITYAIPVGDRRVVSHRVLSAETAADGTVTVQTKGDANDGPDPWQAQLDGDTAWQVRAVVPELGSAIALLRSPGLTEGLVWGLPAALVGWVLLSIWRPAGDEAVDGAVDGGSAVDETTDEATVETADETDAETAHEALRGGRP